MTTLLLIASLVGAIWCGIWLLALAVSYGDSPGPNVVTTAIVLAVVGLVPGLIAWGLGAIPTGVAGLTAASYALMWIMVRTIDAWLVGAAGHNDPLPRALTLARERASAAMGEDPEQDKLLTQLIEQIDIILARRSP